MADNKRKRGKADRARVAGGEGYEVSYFARKHGHYSRADQSTDQESFGNNRDKLNKAAEKMSPR